MSAHYTPGKLLTPKEKRTKAEELRDSLRTLIPMQASRSEINVKVEVIEIDAREDVADGILWAAEKYGVDALCLTRRSRNALKKLVSTSVGESIAKKSRLPLFLVPLDEARHRFVPSLCQLQRQEGPLRA